MQTSLFIVIILTGFILSGAILLMSPKGGIGFGLGGISSANEYGSQKSIESTLKTVATFSAIIMVISIILRPYM